MLLSNMRNVENNQLRQYNAKGDWERVMRCFVNLVKNLIEHAEQGQIVKIQAMLSEHEDEIIIKFYNED